MSRWTLWKAHGLGNDYLVLESGPVLSPKTARAICSRTHGVGADGVLEPFDGPTGTYGVRIWNPDGSIAEKSGNGLRIFAHWKHYVNGGPLAFTLVTGPSSVQCRIKPTSIAVEMGRARQLADNLPHDEGSPWVEREVEVDGAPLRITSINVGNPHAVVFVNPAVLDGQRWKDWGATIERLEAYRDRTNVQFAHIGADGRIDARIWERGAGWTLASGSSSCAVVAAAFLTNRIEAGSHLVHMEGGVLTVSITEELDLVLEGPVTPIGRTTTSLDWDVDGAAGSAT